MQKPTTVKSSRQVIENKLLVSLFEEDKVAVVCNREDLDVLIESLDVCVRAVEASGSAVDTKRQQMSSDLKELRKQAFE